MIYKQTNNTTPVYGEKNSSIGAFQAQLNQQNAGVPGYVPLKVDNMYGPLTAAAANFRRPTQETQTEPTQEQPTQTVGSMYSSIGGGGDNGIARAESDLQNFYLNGNRQDDENIRDSVMRRFQAEIDATNSIYNEKMRQARLTGQGRIGSSTAIQGRRGLLGSDFGAAITDSVNTDNNQIYAGVEAERGQAIAAILGKGDALAMQAIQEKNAAYQKGLEARLEHLKNAGQRREVSAQNAAQAMFEMGIDIGTLQPQELQRILSTFPDSPTSEQVFTKYTSMKKAKEAADLLAQQEAEKEAARIEREGQFNLSEGQARYDIYGNLIASRAKTYAPKSGGGMAGNGIYDMLDYRTANAVISQGNKFGESDIVKKYNNIVAASNLIRSVDPNTENPAEHQAIVYNFAKALDPDSVVREGEYATVKKYSQSLANKYRGELRRAISGKGFLSPEAILAIQGAVDNRIRAAEPQYTNLKSETRNRINALAGVDIADTVLLDYEQGYSGNQIQEQMPEYPGYTYNPQTGNYDQNPD